MARLSASMRRRQAATTSIHDKTPTRKDKILLLGGWVVLVVAVMVLVIGCFAVYKVMTDAREVQLDVVGTRSAAEKLEVITHVSPIVHSNYFAADLRQVRDQTLQLSWVDRVVVSRAWPNAIRIRIMPYHAVARWGAGRLLSDSGQVFTEVSNKDYRHLPLLHGPTAYSHMMMRRYHEINQLFESTDLRLKELYLTDRMTWFMQFDSGLRVIVDQDQTMSKLQRLSYLSQHDLQHVWPRISGVDLRYRNGLALQWKNATPARIVNGNFVVVSNETSIAQQTQKKP